MHLVIMFYLSFKILVVTPSGFYRLNVHIVNRMKTYPLGRNRMDLKILTCDFFKKKLGHGNYTVSN